MGKKKKVDINGKPLEAVTIGQIKQSKYGWIGTILLFALFGGVIYFLPDITKLYQEFESGSTKPAGNSTNNTLVNPDEEEPDAPETPVESKLYLFGTDNVLTKGDLEFTQISYINNVLSFKIVNKSNTTYNLENLNLYFETYDLNTAEKNILNTIAIKGNLAGEATVEYTFNIKGGALYFDIKEIKEDDYTYIDLTPDENNNVVLTCVKGEETVKYTFFNNSLKKVENKVVISKTDVNYDNLYSKYNTLVVKYGTTNGIKTSLSTNMLNMTFNMEIDYSYFTETIENNYYFTSGETPRVVNFKMESELFECS